MLSLNKVTLIGNVGRDPEIRYMQNGDPIMSFSLATTETWQGKSGKEEKTEWHRIDVFGKLASVLKDYIVKGKKIYVEGKLVYDDWTDKQGNKRTMAKVKVAGYGSTIILLGAPEQNSKPRPSQDAPPPQGDDSDLPF